jgi:hypothetical protein
MNVAPYGLGLLLVLEMALSTVVKAPVPPVRFRTIQVVVVVGLPLELATSIWPAANTLPAVSTARPSTPTPADVKSSTAEKLLLFASFSKTSQWETFAKSCVWPPT